jgi:ATP-dependent 26S proteasome regulatory subunit
MIYMPPDMSHRISSPEFVSFLMEHPNSILIIEDAENILCDRESSSNQSISNLLNLSEGILGDALKIKIICTFNTSVDKIDPALRRKGRMIAEYEFKALDESSTARVVKRVHGEDIQSEKKSMTLAEIYGMGNDNFAKTEPEKRKVGFY